MKEYFLLNGSCIPALTAYEYRGYIISAWARPEFTNGYTSVAIVSKQIRPGSFVQVQRIEGELFESKGQAEQHGLERCKEWIDKQTIAKKEMQKRAAIG
jgi:hypothetical protein